MASDNASQVALFLSHCMASLDIEQKDLAREVGFDNPQIIALIKQGKAQLPLNKIDPVAKALQVEPIHLLRLCLEEYQPEMWQVIEPYLDIPQTADERRLLATLRKAVGGPYLAALNQIQVTRFEEFLLCMQYQPGDSTAIH